jgi:hypothetical protein
MTLPGEAGEIRRQNTDNESVCGDFPPASIPHEQMETPVCLPAQQRNRG